MRDLLIGLVVGAAVGLFVPSPAWARPCADYNPVVVRGQVWAVYTGSSPWELENLSCAKARRIARRMIEKRQPTKGWRCSTRLQRCVRGGTYIDGSGHRQWRYKVGWFHGDD